MRIIAGLAVLVVVVLSALYAGGTLRTSVRPEDLDDVLFVIAAPDENRHVVAQVVALIDLDAEGDAVESVSPRTPVVLPGTNFSTIADAYSFGGGYGTSTALARSRNREPLPYVALGPTTFAAAVKRSGGITISLPTEMRVFDGETLYDLQAGSQSLSAEEVVAVFAGAPYLDDGARSRLEDELAHAAVRLVCEWPDDGLTKALASGELDTDLSPEALSAVVAHVTR